MSEVKDRLKLPKGLRADTLMRMPWACRLGFHAWLWLDINPNRYWKQGKRCTRCNKYKERLV